MALGFSLSIHSSIYLYLFSLHMFLGAFQESHGYLHRILGLKEKKRYLRKVYFSARYMCAWRDALNGNKSTFCIYPSPTQSNSYQCELHFLTIFFDVTRQLRTTVTYIHLSLVQFVRSPKPIDWTSVLHQHQHHHYHHHHPLPFHSIPFAWSIP